MAYDHETSLQERERGRLELEESLRKSNAALAAEVLRLREERDRADEAADENERLLNGIDDEWMAATSYDDWLSEAHEKFVAAGKELHEDWPWQAAQSLKVLQEGIAQLEQQLRDANASVNDHSKRAHFLEERLKLAEQQLAEANAMRSKMTDACEQALKREAEYRQELAEANARLAEWSDFDNADSAKRQIAAAYQSRDSWKARALRYEQVTAEVLSRTPTYGGKTLQRCLDTDPMSETTERSARFNLALHVEEILGDLRSIAATPPQDREPEGERLTGLSLDEAKAAVERGLCVETFYPDDPDFKGCTRAIRDGELRVWDPRYPSCGWGKMGIPGHWPDRASFRIVPDPSKPTPTPAAEQQEGGGNV
jgi:hypothetical protein